MKALVTGASSGIGKDMAIYLSELGYDLILVSRDKDKLEITKKLCKTNVDIIPTDLSVKENAFKLYDKVKEENIDLLINGAGYGLFGNTWETDLGRELKMIELNITSLHILTKLFLQDFVKKNKGRTDRPRPRIFTARPRRCARSRTMSSRYPSVSPSAFRSPAG